MKFNYLILLILSTIYFSGCSVKTQPLDRSEYKNYHTIYEVTYDVKCGALEFTKGDRFATYDVGGQTLDNPGMFGSGFTMPKKSIALHIHKSSTGKQIYALIYPDGNFLSDNTNFAYSIVDNDLTAFYQSCKLTDGKVLFKAVKVSNLRKTEGEDFEIISH